MGRGKQLLKNTAIVTVGKISTQLATFLLLPVYTAILSTTEYGVVDLLNTLVSLLLPIVTFQVEQALFRKLIEIREDEEQKGVVITTTIISVTIQCIVYLMIFLLISTFINNEYKYFLATNVIASIFSSLMLQMTRGLGDNTTYAIGSFITTLSTIILNILFIVVFRFGAYGMLTATMLANIVCVIYITIRKKIYKYIIPSQFNMNTLKKLWKYSFPLIPNALSWWIFTASDRIIVSAMLSVGANGILSVAHKFPNVYISFYNILNITWTETAALHINDEDSEKFFSNIINIIIKIFSSLAIGIIACLPFVFNIIINQKFAEAYLYVPILMFASICNVVIGAISVVYVAKKDTKAIASTSIVSAIINIITHLGLIKFIGLYAAPVSTAIAYFSMMIYRFIHVRKYITIKLEKGLILKITIVMALAIIAYYIRNIYFNIFTLVIVIIFVYLLNKSFAKMILDMVKSKFVGGKNGVHQ